MLKPSAILQFEGRPIRVLAVGPRALLSDQFVRTLAKDPRIDLRTQPCDGPGLLDLVRRHRPRVLIISDELLRCSGVTLLRRLMRDLPETRLVLLACAERDGCLAEVIVAGASGCLDPTSHAWDPVSAVECVAAGLHVLAPFALDALRRAAAKPEDEIGAPADAALTTRESGVLAGLLSGRTNKEIAERMGLCEGTVKNHVSRILSKLQVRSRTELVARCRHRLPG